MSLPMTVDCTCRSSLQRFLNQYCWNLLCWDSFRLRCSFPVHVPASETRAYFSNPFASCFVHCMDQIFHAVPDIARRLSEFGITAASFNAHRSRSSHDYLSVVPTTMSDKEKGKTKREATNPTRDEGVAAKLWAVYISEAEKYDKSLVESWKSDMEGMLIFAGLFSASLTAFLVESYKTLSPDSGDQTVQLLAQISQQLASGSNGTAFPISGPLPAFTPSSTSIICNALWFISLGLSLTCALIATLLEQWARDFIHRADMRSAPLIRARIYSYLYYGMKTFNMHVVVDVIPLLLHASLLFFFAGLVVFLIPVSIIMTAIAAALLVLVATTYSILTFLPLRYMDCPYRTPLSAAFWRLFQRIRIIWARPLSADGDRDDPDVSQDDTMMEAMARTAIEDSPARRERDYNALVWTVKSLVDDVELEPFVDALPDVLWGQTVFQGQKVSWGRQGQREVYCDHIRRLVNHRDVQLCSRIDGLYAGTLEGIISPEASQYRQISCYKALWAIASLARRRSSPTEDYELPVDFHELRAYRIPQRELGHYAYSADAMMQWSTFCTVDVGLEEREQYLVRCPAGSSQYLRPPLVPTATFLKSMLWEYGFCPIHSEEISTLKPIPDSQLTPSQIMEQLEIVRALRNTIPYSILFNYLSNCAHLDFCPYQWDETKAAISIDTSVPFCMIQEMLDRHLHCVVHQAGIHSYAGSMPVGSEFSWFDTAMIELSSFWRPTDPVAIPSGIICYLSCRGSHSILGDFLCHSCIGNYVWPCVRPTLHDTDTDWWDIRRALWNLAFIHSCNHGLNTLTAENFPTNPFECYGDALDAMSLDSQEYFGSTIALIKIKILDDVCWSVEDRIAADLRVFLVTHRILPPDTGDLTGCWMDEIEGAGLYLLSEFLECCSSAQLPYKAVETLEEIHRLAVKRSSKSNQIRFATSVQAVFAASSRELLDVVLKLWDGYSDDNFGWCHWITEPIARQTIKEVFTTYESTVSADPDSPKELLERLRAILQGLDVFHPEPESQPPDAAVEADGPEPTQSRLDGISSDGSTAADVLQS
ncbi:hypothetical protein DFH06DRAFT_1211127 [Mycena polygramma]|nr:hypothetical protein DFH06DRAFT_1211127 [Mycena polygramma]